MSFRPRNTGSARPWRHAGVYEHESPSVRQGALREVQDHSPARQRDGHLQQPEAQAEAGVAREWRASPASTSRATSMSRSRSARSEEHTSELQSQFHLVCRLLLEKKKKKKKRTNDSNITYDITHVPNFPID